MRFALPLLTLVTLLDLGNAANVQKAGITLPASAAANKAAVKTAFQTSYDAYTKYAFGHDDLAPVSRGVVDQYGGWGTTIADSLSLMLIMNMTEGYYQKALNYIGTVDFTESKIKDQSISVFETTIRYIAGFLSAYELNGKKDQVLLKQATTIADKLAHAWVGQNAIPFSHLDFSTNQNDGQTSNIAEAGTLTLEFTTLSRLTGNSTYGRLAQGSVQKIINNPTVLAGLPAQGIDPKTGKPVGSYVTWGGGSDSYFEYLIKFPRLFANSDPSYASTWLQAVETSIQKLKSTSTVGNHVYLADFDGQNIRHVGSHLACFHAGNWILGGRLLGNENIVNTALELNEGCWNTYASTATGIGPEAFAWVSPGTNGAYTGGPNPSNSDNAFYNKNGFYIFNGGSDYILRPEVLESNFYAYRATGDTKYLDRAASALQAFNRVLKVKTGGYKGINDVNNANGGGDIDDMQSFWFAEVLKYLYLTFDDPNHISLDSYVFNTEGHPFPAGPASIKTGTPVTGGQFSKAEGKVPQVSPNAALPKPLDSIFGFDTWSLLDLFGVIGL